MDSISNIFMLRKIIDNSITSAVKELSIARCPPKPLKSCRGNLKTSHLYQKIVSQKTIGRELSSLSNNISFLKRIINRLKESIEMFEKLFELSKKYIENLESFNKFTSNLIRTNQQFKRVRSPEEKENSRKKSKKHLSCPPILD
ncbi:hypothetical protein BpHYR1_001315 [Brachionus plicatilis]|uniref:Uncharacterized protein n=1 Tax=Brachionus plicatilis TaxID=10195 RepID=A0A3M7T7L0_BRAPC|nr:hypothetical protein BpHYR1_001315 [Brachionus plicatilis]